MQGSILSNKKTGLPEIIAINVKSHQSKTYYNEVVLE